jgi:G3E family GTPase
MSEKERLNYPSYVQYKPELDKKWDKEFGDRQNELVIIGQDLEQETIIAELAACLCTKEEIIAMNKGKKFKDSFPVW